MVMGVVTETVSNIFKRIPLKKRLSVKTVTTNLSSAMMLTVKAAFPAAKLINDRFHVQQLMSGAVDQIRIRHRWEVLDKANKEIKEHRQKRKECQNAKKREALGRWSPQIMENGETMPRIMARSRHVILKHKSKWNDRQKARAKILFQQFPDLEKGYRLLLDLVDIFNKKSIPDEARLNLVRWLTVLINSIIGSLTRYWIHSRTTTLPS